MKNKKKMVMDINLDYRIIWLQNVIKKIFPYIKKKFGPSLLINGDDL